MRLAACLLLLCLFLVFCGAIVECRKTTRVRTLPTAQVTYSLSDAKNSLNFAMAAYCSGYLGFGVANWTCPTCRKAPGMKDIVVLFNEEDDTNGYVGYHSVQNRIVIAFSGTNPTAIRDWLDDLDFILTDYPPCSQNARPTVVTEVETNVTQYELVELKELKRKFNNRHFNTAFHNTLKIGADGSLKKRLTTASAGCQVHGGFYRTYLSVAVALKAHVEELLVKYPEVNEVLITGHSLGGALAVHSAVDLLVSNFSRKLSILPLYTFGQPRVGNPQFEEFFQRLQSNFRVIHWRDPVPHLPPHAFGFAHNPEEIFYPDTGDQYVSCSTTNGEDTTCSDSMLDWRVDDHLFYLDFDVIVNYLECRL